MYPILPLISWYDLLVNSPSSLLVEAVVVNDALESCPTQLLNTRTMS